MRWSCPGSFWTLLFAAIRMASLLSFRRRDPVREEMLRWQRLYEWTACASGLSWGLGAMLFLPGLHVIYQVVLRVCVGGDGGRCDAGHGRPTPVVCHLSV